MSKKKLFEDNADHGRQFLTVVATEFVFHVFGNDAIINIRVFSKDIFVLLIYFFRVRYMIQLFSLQHRAEQQLPRGVLPTSLRLLYLVIWLHSGRIKKFFDPEVQVISPFLKASCANSNSDQMILPVAFLISPQKSQETVKISVSLE